MSRVNAASARASSIRVFMPEIIVHAVRVISGELREGGRVDAAPDLVRRQSVSNNHTATHLLHAALRQVLGDHVKQAGSAVRPDKLRFDFTHPQALSAEERTEVEKRVNERVFQNLPVRTFETPIEEARTLGAMMLFGEKYGSIVRVVDIGGWSVELCGGTHVRSTAEIGPFAILSEASVGAGARRIEAVTSGEAYALLHERAREADALRGELEKARKTSGKPKQEAAYELGDRVDGVVFAQTRDLQPGPLRDLSDRIRQQEKVDGAIVFSVTDGRVHIVVNLDPSLGVDAAKLAVEMGQIVGGRGGGKPTMAQAGGNLPDAIPQAIEAGKKALS